MSDNAKVRQRLLLVAFECSPNHGSEWANGWNRALEAARHYDVCVITQGNQQEEEIRRYLADHSPIPHLQFEYIPCNAFRKYPTHVGGRLWLAYSKWQREVLKRAQEWHAIHHFDLFHQVTNTGFREPGHLWQLDVPFVWGPIGGTHNYPWRFLSEAGWRGALSEGLRGFANTLQLNFSGRGLRAAKRARAVLAANSTSCEQFRRARGIRPIELLDVGISTVADAPRPPRDPQAPLRILWSGQFAPRKALSLLLKALAKLPTDMPYELRVVGSGPLEKRWKHLAERLGISARIDWRGWMSHEQARQQYDWADVFAFTSLRDNSGTVVLEAMGAGVPILCLDHQGVRDMVTDRCGIKIPVTNPRQVVVDLAAALVRLAHDSRLRDQLGAEAHQRAHEYLWTNLGKKMAEVYRNVLSEPAVAPVTAKEPTPSAPPRLQPSLREAAIWTVARAAAGMQAVRGRRPGNGFGILTFHRVTDRVSGHPTPTWNNPPAQLKCQLQGLLARGYQAWALSDLLRAHAAGENIPGGVFAVTFDDGYENNFTEALPVLESLGVPATIFLATAYLDQTSPFPFDDWSGRGQAGVPSSAWRPLSTTQCRQLLESGLIELGTHTHTHQKFQNRVTDFSQDLAASIDLMNTRFGVRNPVLAFPHGIFNQPMLDAARELGIPCALTTIPGLQQITSDPLGWGRFTVERHDTAATLAGKLAGWYTPLTRGLRAMGRGGSATVAPAESTPRTLPENSVQAPLDEQPTEHALVECE